MIKFLKMTSLALALMAATPAAADVFGVKMGANPIALGAELQPEHAGEPVRPYLLETLPEPHPEFEMLMLNSSAKTGVCRIAGLGRYYKGDTTGSRVLSAFHVQRAAMDKLYGASRLAPQDGKPVAHWDFRSGAELPADIQSITLETAGADDTYLVARYDLANFNACEAQL